MQAIVTLHRVAAEDSNAEKRLLVVSMVAAAVLGVVGVVWGILVGSQMILLDGIYSFVGIVLSGLLLWASALSEREPTRRFQFGMEAATPLAIAIQAFVLLATLLYAAVEAVYALRSGGSEITAGWGIAYGIVAAVSCVLAAVELGRRSGHSDLLLSEAAAWRVAAWRGAGMVVGFVVLLLLQRSRWSGAAPYVDPAMVIISCVALLPTPLGLLRRTVAELLEGAPGREISELVHAAVREVQAAASLDEPTVHLSKVGSKLYVEMNTTAGPDTTISQEHEVREALRRRLDALPHEVWLNVELRPREPVTGP